MQKIRSGPKNPTIITDDGNRIFQTSDNMGIDLNGDIYLQIGENMSMDMDTGELHLSFGWNNNDDDF